MTAVVMQFVLGPFSPRPPSIGGSMRCRSGGPQLDDLIDDFVQEFGLGHLRALAEASEKVGLGQGFSPQPSVQHG